MILILRRLEVAWTMNKLFLFICCSALITCIGSEVLQVENETQMSNDQQMAADAVPQNHTDGSAPLEMELLMPQLSEAGNEDNQSSSESANDGNASSVQLAASDDFRTTSGASAHCGLLPNTSRAASFLDIVIGLGDSLVKALHMDEDDSRQHLTHGIKKITCVSLNDSDISDPPSVKIVNSSELLLHLGSRNSTIGRCTVVLFYAPWCTFSARVAPHYNALARAFPRLNVVAIDAFHFSNLNSRFGTIAVPNVMIFHNAKAIARFNGSERTLASLTSFVSNITGLSANASVEVIAEDYVGPLQSDPSQELDHLLLLSWAFVILCCCLGVARSSAGVRVWNTLVAMGHHEQNHHQHID